MGREQNKLTVVALRSLVREAARTGRTTAKADGGGLTFTVSPNGYPAWVLRYRYQGMSREYTLDKVDATGEGFGLVQAREERDALRKRIREGEDIAQTKKYDQNKRLLTFRAVADEWFTHQISTAHKHPEIVRRVLDKDILPNLGALSPEDVQPHHLDSVLRGIVKRGAPTVANDALRYIKSILTFARKRRIVTHNVAADFDLSDAGGKEKPRRRQLNRKELKTLFKAMRETPEFGRPNELAFKILLATCARKTELVAARWEEFDLEAGTWHLSAERTKSGEALDIPLAAPVVAWLKELKVFAAGSAYVLPARRITKRKRFPHISLDTLNVALKRVEHGLGHFTVHDARRTSRTLLADLGVSREVAERALNHKLRGIEGVYNQHDYFKERKLASELWANLIVALDRGEDYNVLPLHRAS